MSGSANNPYLESRDDLLRIMTASNAGAHNAIYRGKYLGTSVTAAQYAAIVAGIHSGGAAVRQPCAVCTGAAHECSTEPVKQLPILGGRHTHNDERNSTGTALAGDDMGADYRLYAESSRQHAPGGQYWRRMGSCADGGADADTRPLCWRGKSRCTKRIKLSGMAFRPKRRQRRRWREVLSAFGNESWWRPAHAHREQVHSFLYVAAHRLTPKGVAV